MWPIPGDKKMNAVSCSEHLDMAFRGERNTASKYRFVSLILMLKRLDRTQVHHDEGIMVEIYDCRGNGHGICAQELDPNPCARGFQRTTWYPSTEPTDADTSRIHQKVA